MCFTQTLLCNVGVVEAGHTANNSSWTQLKQLLEELQQLRGEVKQCRCCKTDGAHPATLSGNSAKGLELYCVVRWPCSYIRYLLVCLNFTAGLLLFNTVKFDLI